MSLEDCKSLTRKNIQTCNLVATNATIQNLNVTNPIVVPPAPTCNVAVTRISYFGAPDSIQRLQLGFQNIQWEMLQVWVQYGRLEPFSALLGASIFSANIPTPSLTPVPAPFANPAVTLAQEYLDFLNDAFAQTGLSSSDGLQAQPAITTGNASSPQLAIRSTTLNLTNYVFLVRRINDSVENCVYAYAMDGAVPFMNCSTFNSQTQSGESVWSFTGPMPIPLFPQPQDSIFDIFTVIPAYFTPIPTILGFSTCGGQLATDQQMNPPASSTILLNP
jgi:hypothetical protein